MPPPPDSILRLTIPPGPLSVRREVFWEVMRGTDVFVPPDIQQAHDHIWAQPPHPDALYDFNLPPGMTESEFFSRHVRLHERLRDAWQPSFPMAPGAIVVAQAHAQANNKSC